MNLIALPEILCTAFMISIISYVYSVILTEPNMFLHPLYKWIEGKIGRYPYLFKPIIDCDRCVSGQLAFWYYLIPFIQLKSFSNYHFFTGHIFLICLTIFTTQTLQKVHRWTKSQS